MAKTKKVTTHLSCEKCKSKNYTQIINKKRKIGSLVLNKFCPKIGCQQHKIHKETK